MEELLLGVLGGFLFKKIDKWREAQEKAEAEKREHFENLIRLYKRGEWVISRANGRPPEKEHLQMMVEAHGQDKDEFLQFIDFNYDRIN